MIFGNVEKSYDYVETLKYKLLRRNPGSHVDIKLEPDLCISEDVCVLQSINR